MVAQPSPESGERESSQAVLDATKQLASVLKGDQRRFALAGGVAAYAQGVPRRSLHDADFCILKEDAESIAELLGRAGIRVWEPPEDWLVKAECQGQLVDLIFELADQPVTPELLERADELSVDSVRMPVLAPTDLLTSLIGAFSEHHCDFGAVLPIARTLRERIDWDVVRAKAQGGPMPEAFLFLLERLDVVAPAGATGEVSGDERT
ncbi:nucleotidyltransferase family protein [Kitasatospora sp. NPDC056138]|uniref:nucleotidyltransferase family protein n=1 Tax=Kitasatospora sp. NPDC056138 TaxID=3345724 RepID=UPI0035DC0375